MMINILQNINPIDYELIKRVNGKYYDDIDEKEKYRIFRPDKTCVDCGKLIASTREFVNGKTNRCADCLEVQLKIWARNQRLKANVKKTLKTYANHCKFKELFENEVRSILDIDFHKMTDSQNKNYLERLRYIRKFMKNI